MNRSTRTALAALSLLPAAALAQSSVTIAGIMDAGLRQDWGSNEGRIRSVSSGQMYGSRLDFMGVEDLGDGLRAGFVLETGMALDTGTGTNNPPGVTSGISWGRTSAISFGSERTGYLSMGRQYTPLWALSASGSNDPFVGSWLGGNAVVYSNTVMVSNSIVYSYGYGPRTMLNAAPRQGFGAVLLYGVGEALDPAPSSSGEQIGFNVSYGSGPVFVGYAYHQIKGNGPAINPAAPSTDTPKLRQQTLSFAYDFGFARLHVGANTGKNDAPIATRLDRRSWTVGATVPVAAQQTVRVMYGHANNRARDNADWSALQVGYTYDFSKRTAVYAAFGQIDNDDAAATAFGRSLGTFAAGSTPRAAILGIKHTF